MEIRMLEVLMLPPRRMHERLGLLLREQCEGSTVHLRTYCKADA